MKKYIFLTNSITNMGGGQMYVANKCEYLRSQGWDVRVYYNNPKGDILIPALRVFKNNRIDNLGYPITYLTSLQRNEVVNKITSSINSADKVVVESHTFQLSFWGEMIAKRVQGTHIISCLEESIPSFTKGVTRFYEWKLKRWEILNAGTEKWMRRYFKKHFKPEYLNYTHNYMQLAYCSNVTTKDEIDLSMISPSDFSILSIGRLDKPYIIPSVKEIIILAHQYKQYSFNLLFVGASTNGTSKIEIDKLCESVSNLHVHHFGYLFPVPENLICSADVAFGVSNSVLVSSDLGVPTISIDVNDNLPIGIYGQTTDSHFTRNNEAAVPLSILLKEVLVNKKYQKGKVASKNDHELFEETFNKQIEFLKKSKNDGEYYDVINIYSPIKYCLDNLKRIIRKYI